MRRQLIALMVACIFAAGIYSGSAFYAGWQIREAMRTGDTAVLQRRVDWPSVRQTLKQTATETRALMSEMSASAGVNMAKPGLWTRIKEAAAPYLADPLIDRYVTAESAPQIWKWRQTWRQKVRPTIGFKEPATPLASTFLAGSAVDQGLAIARRVERAAFTSPFRMEMELRDRYVEGRRWRAAFEMRDWSWVLAEVHLVRTAPAATAASARLMAR